MSSALPLPPSCLHIFHCLMLFRHSFPSVVFIFFSFFFSLLYYHTLCFLFFFFNDTATPEISPLSLHDPLPIPQRTACGANDRYARGARRHRRERPILPFPRVPHRRPQATQRRAHHYPAGHQGPQCPARGRSEEHTSELQSHSDLVCRLLLEKKN